MLYTYYFVYFLLVGILLLIGMVGAIVLTLSTKKNSKAQSVFRQLSRKMEKATFVAKFKN
jgi:NADH-quinone oxidoreductase subunit J